MSRGHGRMQRIILQAVHATRYGCTVRQLAYLTSVGRGDDGPSEAHVGAVDRTVRRLLDEERLVERSMFGTERYLLPASPAMPTSPGSQTLQCEACDLQWVSEEGAPHRLCWSCGDPGQPVRALVGHPGGRRSPRSR
jgi:hypothetical protein